jgi:hypothetical protein
MLGDKLADTIVERVALLVEDQRVGVAVVLLEGEL